MAEKYQNLIKETLETCQKHYGDDKGWVPLYAQDGTIGESKPLEGNSVHIFRCTGVIPASPKALIDLIWGFNAQDWDNDGSLLKWEVREKLSNTMRIVYQINKVPFPLWSRDACLLQAIVELSGGSYALVIKSIDHPSCPRDDANYVRALVSFSAYIFVPEDEGTSRLNRIIHLDPSGVVPGFLVNKKATGLFETIKDLRDRVESMK